MHKYLSTIIEETELFTVIKDIRDELNINLTILQDQRNVLKPLTAIINEFTHDVASGGKDKTGHLRSMSEEGRESSGCDVRQELQSGGHQCQGFRSDARACKRCLRLGRSRIK